MMERQERSAETMCVLLVSAISCWQWSAIHQVLPERGQSAWSAHTGVFCGQGCWRGHVYTGWPGVWQGENVQNITVTH